MYISDGEDFAFMPLITNTLDVIAAAKSA